MSAHGSAHPGQASPGVAHGGIASASALIRPAAAFAVLLAGMSWVAGWATDSSGVWLAWPAIGIVAGVVAGSVRATWLVAPATLLVYPVAALAGRTSASVQPELTLWALLVLVGGVITAGGFAAGAAAVERRVSRLVVVAILAAVLALVTWVVVGGWMTSTEIVVADSTSNDCDTPASTFGWSYEAINYDPADDARLAATPGGLHGCATQGAGAGTEVVTSDGIPIAGWYIPAASGADTTAPTIVIVPGWKANKSEVLKYAPFFHERFNLVLLDLRNQGRSGGTTTTFGATEQRDVRTIVDWLERTKHPKWIGGMGNSMGAATLTAAAASDPRIQALILDSMHATMAASFADGIAHERNLPGLPAAWAGVTMASLRAGIDLTSVDPVRVIGTLGTRPVLLIHGTADELDTVDHAAIPNVEAARAGGVPVTVRWCEGGTHGQLVDATGCPAPWQVWVDEFLAGIPGATSSEGSAP